MISMNALHNRTKINRFRPSALALYLFEEQKQKVEETNKSPDHKSILRMENWAM